MAILYGVVTLGIGYFWGYDDRQMRLLQILVFNQFLVSFILYLRSNITGLLLFRTDSIISVLDRLLMILICSVLLWGNVTEIPFQIEWFVWAQTAAYAITAAVAMIVVIKQSSFRKLQWNLPFFVMILRKSFPYALLVLLMSFYTRIDSVLIERILPKQIGEEQVSIYALAFRYLDAANMISFLFAGMLLPIFARMISRRESVENMVKLSFSILFAGSFVVAIASYFYKEDFMYLLYTKHSTETLEMFNVRIQQASDIFSVLMFSFVAVSTIYIFGTLLTAKGSMKLLNIVAGIGVILSLGLNFILIPHFMALGSAYASLITQTLTAFVQVLIVQYIFKFRINYKYIFTLVAFVLGVIIFSYISTLLPFLWIVNIALIGMASFSLALLLKLFSIKELVKIFKDE